MEDIESSMSYAGTEFCAGNSGENQLILPRLPAQDSAPRLLIWKAFSDASGVRASGRGEED